jgi:two-component system phosphate regulon sensor histidine kinase PhoR
VKKPDSLPLIFALSISVTVLLILVVIYFIYGVPSIIAIVATPVLISLATWFFARWAFRQETSTLIHHIDSEEYQPEGANKLIGEESMQVVKKIRGIENYRKEFMGNVYHELKTPIFNLQGYISTLVDGGLKDESINKLYLERSVKNINRMITIVEDLESISRIETEKVSLKLERFDIRRTVEEVYEANEMRAEKKDVKLMFAMSKEIPVYVMADKKKIYQVLNNLVVNSINYGSDPGKVKINFVPDGKIVTVEVKDNGLGISSDDLPRIFERFYRVDKSRSRDSGGTGLGLAIVKHIIEAHNQTITVKSTPGKGTTFSFTLNRG